MPSPIMNRRIDYFAMAVMQTIIGIDGMDLALAKYSARTGEEKEVVLAKAAYNIAEAMEAEANNH